MVFGCDETTSRRSKRDPIHAVVVAEIKSGQDLVCLFLSIYEREVDLLGRCCIENILLHDNKM